jgi:hypothetical protein
MSKWITSLSPVTEGNKSSILIEWAINGIISAGICFVLKVI